MSLCTRDAGSVEGNHRGYSLSQNPHKSQKKDKYAVIRLDEYTLNTKTIYSARLNDQAQQK